MKLSLSNPNAVRFLVMPAFTLCMAPVSTRSFIQKTGHLIKSSKCVVLDSHCIDLQDSCFLVLYSPAANHDKLVVGHSCNRSSNVLGVSFHLQILVGCSFYFP